MPNLPLPHLRRALTTPYTISKSVRSPINHLSRPHASELDLHVTAAELTILIGAMVIMIALLSWLAWICLSQFVRFVRGKMDDRALERREVRRREDGNGERVFGRVRGFVEGVFGGGKTRRGDGREAGEGSSLLDGGRYGGAGWRREGERYDGTSESSGRTTVVHREDCERACGMQSRRRSAGSDGR